jgi:hypothetical protein
VTADVVGVTFERRAQIGLSSATPPPGQCLNHHVPRHEERGFQDGRQESVACSDAAHRTGAVDFASAGSDRIQGCQTLEVLAHATHGILMLDAKGKILFANRRANALLSLADGISLGSDGLRGVIQTLTERLRNLSTGGLHRRWRCDFPYATPRLRFAICRNRAVQSGSWLAIEAGASRDHAIPERRVSVRLDAATFAVRIRSFAGGGTRCREIASGTGSEGIAASLSISRNTARVHLNAILSKRGTHRQSEPMRRLVGVADLCSASHTLKM